ncbi:hypothetical protein HYS96_03750 [Candidatus Daviesbacteria bacterium]|nr:hypothetical protein [Candidatus Daviesbacteria bacterium]
MSPDVKKGLIIFGVVSLLGGIPKAKDWWDSQPQECYTQGDYGRSTINLRRRIALGEGTQNIELKPDFLTQAENVIQISHTDPNCPETNVYLQYHPLTQSIALVGRLSSRNLNLETRWEAGKIDVPPTQPHVIAVVWSEWRVLGVLVDGRNTEVFKPREPINYLIP